MSLEEVMNNVSILNDKTCFNHAIGVFILGIVIIVGFVYMFIIDSLHCPRPMCVLFILAGVSTAIISGIDFFKRPEIIKLQIIANVQTVSEQQLAEYFELSNVVIGDGKIICDIEPKYDYFNPEKNYYDEVRAVLREVKEEQQ